MLDRVTHINLASRNQDLHPLALCRVVSKVVALAAPDPVHRGAHRGRLEQEEEVLVDLRLGELGCLTALQDPES